MPIPALAWQERARRVEEGFRLERAAAEPLIFGPGAMVVEEQGRT